ncbi:amidase [Acidiferrimicrobium sp. IK]|nr:amidase [Acidiferrimicrobium sp. IK]
MAASVRAGTVSPSELVATAIERIERLDPTINAVIHRRFERAVSEAAGPLPDGPLRGVPVLIKDLGAPSAGDPRHDGLRVLAAAGWVSDHDAAVVTRLRAAGAVVVGRTNAPEMGTTITTEPVAHGPTRNPWSLSHSAGGSSGGSAAAVAAGMTPVAHATDGGGSIRIPASNCGLVGLKPARGRVSKAPDRGESWMGGGVEGVVSRTVRDTALLLDVMAGPEIGDPYAAPALPGPLVAEVGRPPGRLRIGVLDHPPDDPAAGDPEAAAAVAAAAALLGEAGHDVEPAWPHALGDAEYPGRFLTVLAVCVNADLAAWEAVLGRRISDDDLEPANAALRHMGGKVSAPDYVGTINWLHAWSRRVGGWWASGYDLLLSPVLNGPPPELGWLTDPEMGGSRVAALTRYTSQWNMTGQPAVSLPLHTSAAGLPMGVQLVAGAGREDLLVRVASQVEAAVPWADRHPALAG